MKFAYGIWAENKDTNHLESPTKYICSKAGNCSGPLPTTLGGHDMFNTIMTVFLKDK